MKFRIDAHKRESASKRETERQVPFVMDDIYLVSVLEKLQFCKLHPNSGKCQ